MKKLKTHTHLTAFILAISLSYAQQDSSIVSNKDIKQFIQSQKGELSYGNLDARILNWTDCDLFLIQDKCWIGDFIRKDADTLITEEDLLCFQWQHKALASSKVSVFPFLKERNPQKPHSQTSIPLFSQNRKLAIIKVSYWCGDECGSGGIRIFKKIGKKWKFIEERCGWTS